jgi:hypothetical protein
VGSPYAYDMPMFFKENSGMQKGHKNVAVIYSYQEQKCRHLENEGYNTGKFGNIFLSMIKTCWDCSIYETNVLNVNRPLLILNHTF